VNDELSGDLFASHPEPRKRARTVDPHTSHIAAKRVSEFDDGMFAKIEAVLSANPKTTHTIARYAGLKEDQVHKRMIELHRMRRAQLVIDENGLPVTAPGPSGRPCRVWVKP
jgi:hypothetical protein